MDKAQTAFERRQAWDNCKAVPDVQDEQKPRKMRAFVQLIVCTIFGAMVLILGFFSKSSLLLLIISVNENSKAVVAKPYALLFLGCTIIAPSVLTFIKSLWKMTFKDSKTPLCQTLLWVTCIEFFVAFGTAVLVLVAMPYFDVLTNLMMLNSVTILPAVFQVVGNPIRKGRKRSKITSILAVIFTVFGYVLFIIGYQTDSATSNQVSALPIGLAIVGTLCISLNWWETYSKILKSSFLERMAEDTKRCRNIICLVSSSVRIAVTAAVLGAYVKLSGQQWSTVLSVSQQTKTIVLSLFAIQIISTALCYWFAVAACKMHAVRRSFVIPMWLVSPVVLAAFLLVSVDFRFSAICPELITPSGSGNNAFSLLSADVRQTLCARTMFLKRQPVGLALVGISLICWWVGLMLCTLYTCFMKISRIERTQDLFVRRLYETAFIDQSMLLNIRFQDQISKKSQSEKKETILIHLCATMWHETFDEMMKIIISMFRLDKFRPRKNNNNDVKFEFHIFFDDAFQTKEGKNQRQVNEYVEILVDVMKEVYILFGDETSSSIFKEAYALPAQKIIQTPYGGRLRYTLPQGNILVVHMKDKNLIRHKKRWSQIMYLYYLLGWKLNRKYYRRYEIGEQKYTLEDLWKKEKQNTCILALDGDTDFQPSSVMLLVDRLRLYPDVGAVCGRIHPTGTGPMVWYQKFEYAVGHWLQKAAEHVFGCVLCSPGCFSLFRAEALMDDNVMKKYTTNATEASHFLQYDQGEDRWLCTLLLQQGWRVEYNAASDAYTNAPQEFKEFYNQRRRWGPSTMANTLDLLSTSSLTIQKNKSISKPYIIYQTFNMASSILGPATVCLMTAGCFSFVFHLDSNISLILAIIPPAIYLGLCFKLKSDTQISIAAIMSIFYAFLMAAALMSMIGNMVINDTFLTPSGLFLISIVLLHTVTAALHPQEFHLIIYGFLYFICIPSGYVLLAIYSMVNMNNVSWGTRESASPAKPANSNKAANRNRQMPTNNGILCHRSCRCCSWNIKVQVDDDQKQEEDQSFQPEEIETQPIHEDREEKEEDPSVPYWISQLKKKSCELALEEDTLQSDETQFWRDLQERYLKPLDEDKKKKKQIEKDLIDLRNKVNFVFFICNALWLVATFFLQIMGNSVTIPIPKTFPNGTVDNNAKFFIDPIGMMILLSFATLLLVQFFAMIWHRIHTLIHYVAYNGTASKERKALGKSLDDISKEKNFL